MDWCPIYETEVAEVLRTTLNSEATGWDQTANFWLKDLTETQAYLATLFNKLIEESQILDWLTIGVTSLIPKNENTERPKNYRSVICLPTIQIIITLIISRVHAVAQLVEALRYKPEGRGFDSRWCHWNFPFT